MSFVAVGVAAGVVVGGVAGSVIASDASRHAANIQADAAKNANSTQLLMQQVALNNLLQNTAPYRDVGQGALYQLAGLLGIPASSLGKVATGVDPTGAQTGTAAVPSGYGSLTPDQLMQLDPGYQFRLKQGNTALENLASRTGISGGTFKGLEEYNQGFASNEFQNIVNRLASVAGLGENAAAGVGNTSAQLISNTGQSIANNTIGAGNALAAGAVGSANAYSQGLSSIGNTAGQLYTLNQLFNQPSSTSGSTGSSGFGFSGLEGETGAPVASPTPGG